MAKIAPTLLFCLLFIVLTSLAHGDGGDGDDGSGSGGDGGSSGGDSSSGSGGKGGKGQRFQKKILKKIQDSSASDDDKQKATDCINGCFTAGQTCKSDASKDKKTCRKEGMECCKGCTNGVTGLEDVMAFKGRKGGKRKGKGKDKSGGSSDADTDE